MYYNTLKSSLTFRHKNGLMDIDENPQVGEAKKKVGDNFELNFREVPPYWTEVNPGTKIDYKRVMLDEMLNGWSKNS